MTNSPEKGNLEPTCSLKSSEQGASGMMIDKMIMLMNFEGRKNLNGNEIRWELIIFKILYLDLLCFINYLIQNGINSYPSTAEHRV